MLVIKVLLYCCLLTAVAGASRKSRVAGGMRVLSSRQLPWMVLLKPEREVRYFNQTKTIIETYLCSGSFIDIYGSVLTAGHCLNREEPIMENRTVKGMRRLLHVKVIWGTTKEGTGGKSEKVPEGPRISRYKMATPSLICSRGSTETGQVDIALIHLRRFRDSAMDCLENSVPQPIKIASGGVENLQEAGLFAGFGVQAIRVAPSRWQFTSPKELMAIYMTYDYHSDPTDPESETEEPKPKQFGKHLWLFHARGVDNNTQQGRSRYLGTCEGDSGGPYMVFESDELKQRGVATDGLMCDRDDCVRAGDRNDFIDITNSDVLEWIRRKLRKRYSILRKLGPIPKTC